jgi:hypothetical protein
MPTTAKTHNYGTRLERSTDNSSWTTVGDCRVIRMPKNEPSKADITHLESPNKKREKMGSWKDDGDAGFTCLFVASQYAALKALEAAETVLYWRVSTALLAGQATRSATVFQGGIISCRQNDIEVGDEPVTYDVMIAVQDEETFTAAT